MATANPFDLLGDDDTEDPLQLIAAQQPKIAPVKKAPAPAKSAQQLPTKPAAKLPSKPLPPAQAVKEAKDETARGGGRGGGRGYGRGRGRGFNRDFGNNENSFGNSRFSSGQGGPEETDAEKPYERRGGYGGPRGSFRGGRRGGFSNGDLGDGEHEQEREQERPRSRIFERHSGTGRGNEFKRDGAGRGNWGMQTEELKQATEEVVNEGERKFGDEKPSVEENATDGNKENHTNEPEEKESEEKEMTLEEYEKVIEEKRKALQTLKTEERKVDVKEFETMQQLSNKKNNEDIFIKLGSEKDKRAEKEEKAKKAVSINEFLKPAEGEKFYSSGGRGRGRGRGRGGARGGGGGRMSNMEEGLLSIEDPGQFPTLGAK